jgi:hypothetical protein
VYKRAGLGSHLALSGGGGDEVSGVEHELVSPLELLCWSMFLAILVISSMSCITDCVQPCQDAAAWVLLDCLAGQKEVMWRNDRSGKMKRGWREGGALLYLVEGISRRARYVVRLVG